MELTETKIHILLLLAPKKSWFSEKEAVRKVEEIDLYQFQPFTSDYLVARTKTDDDTIR
jgi:hypothetical protein